jgi:hypothetical protein
MLQGQLGEGLGMSMLKLILPCLRLERSYSFLTAFRTIQRAAFPIWVSEDLCPGPELVSSQRSCRSSFPIATDQTYRASEYRFYQAFWKSSRLTSHMKGQLHNRWCYQSCLKQTCLRPGPTAMAGVRCLAMDTASLKDSLSSAYVKAMSEWLVYVVCI